jgi:S1-C subfamily serine protease
VNLVDVIIVLFVIGSLARGFRIGFTHQLGSTLGFVVGLFIGSWLSGILVPHVQSSVSKSFLSLFVVLFSGFIFMTMGEVLGMRLKARLMQNKYLDIFDGWFGSVIAGVTMLFALWLGASILVLGPTSGFQQSLKSSRILSALDSHLPPATQLLSSLNKLIDPNGFPQVFSGFEPNPQTTTKVPSLGSLNSVVQAAQASVVKIEGTGCGGIVEGSGFVYGSDEIATNAHVVAGVASPKVLDSNGIHNTQVVMFDPDVDLAVLRVKNLAGKPLTINATDQPANTPGVVLGYPGGGDFNAQPAAVIDHFTALGRNIYGGGNTERDIYSLRAKVIPGNSGGPVVGADGSVLGVVFATSTAYNNVGYALTGHQVAAELANAEHATTTVGTGACSE